VTYFWGLEQPAWSDQTVNDNAPFTDPKRISFIERKKDVRRILVNPHIQEYVRYSSDETGEIDRSQRISHFVRKKPESPIDAQDGFLEPILHDKENQTQNNRIDC